MIKLNLGSANTFLEGYTNVDRIFPPSWVIPKKYQTQEVDLNVYPWPWDDSSVEHIIAHDIIEHLPDRIGTMNEIWRVLAPGGQVEIIVPDALMGAGFLQDPTHVSMWTMNSFQYYMEGSFARGRLGEAYGIKARFKYAVIADVNPQRMRYNPDPFDEVYKVHVTLEAVK